MNNAGTAGFRNFLRQETNFPPLSARYSVVTPVVRGRKQNIALCDAIPRSAGGMMLPRPVTERKMMNATEE